MKNFSLIITAGGTSSRYGNKNKLLEKINDKTVIEETVSKFIDFDEIDEVKMCKNFGFENPPYINLTSVLPVSEKKALSESKQGLKRFHISSK